MASDADDVRLALRELALLRKDLAKLKERVEVEATVTWVVTNAILDRLSTSERRAAQDRAMRLAGSAEVIAALTKMFGRETDDRRD